MYLIVTLEPVHPTVMRAIQMILEGASPLPMSNGRCELWWPEHKTHVLDDAAEAMSVLVLVGCADARELSGHADWRSYRAALGRELELEGFDQVHAVACPIHGSQTIRFAEGAFAADVLRLREDARIWLYAVPGAASHQRAGWNQAAPPPY
ncbi:hypothetical protein J5226_19240 [Lysobacter sp. K5869]|uniref:hypothetical protein n=1 Tax=Lysobacter sp. K5869 TaxID=2820808 RepID=UPI001C0611A0|nr:hypothetical protein [Lysobacter sp. K5869]QWP75722.1 hypothetical protein J5226_19240 [Lysobacter sp. K5869]